jgi:hypothetical protein
MKKENKREFKNIREFKNELHRLELDLSMYHDNMYDAGDDSTLRGIYFSKMTQAKAKIDELKMDYPEYVL